jgi:hypothetical protein
MTTMTDVLPARADALVRGRPLLAHRATGRLLFGLVVIATCVYALRRPTSIVSPAFFAEDGIILFKDALERGWASLLEPFAGQFLLFHRVTAWVSSALPVLIQPAAYMAAAVAAAVTSCSIVLSARWRVPAPIIVRFACLIALLCSPAVDESYANLLNSHWWLGIGLLLLGMLHDPLSQRLKLAEITFVAVSALSGFAALYGLPSLVVRAVRERSRQSVALMSIATAGLLLQIVSLTSSTRRSDIGVIVSQPGEAVMVLIKRVFAAAALGDANLREGWPQYAAEWWVSLVTLTLIGALVLVWTRIPWLESAALILTLLGGWILAIYAMGGPGRSIDQLVTWPGSASRYFVCPIALLFVGLILARQRAAMAWLGSTVACILLAVGIMSDYHLSPWQKVDWEPFSKCVEQAAATCTTNIPPGWVLEFEPRSR